MIPLAGMNFRGMENPGKVGANYGTLSKIWEEYQDGAL